jgi:hypothetical protein
MTDTTRQLDQAKPGITRRTFAAGTAWAIPAVAVASAAPAHAVSLIKYPGINGWVINRPTSRGSCEYYLEVDSTLPGAPNVPGFTDGAPYGLYIYDVEPANTFSDAKITYWIIGDQNATWTELSGHGSCWSDAARGTPTTQPDGYIYTPYTWTYNCAINASDYALDPIDGQYRLYLQDFHVQASFTQPGNRCNNVTYWTQRSIYVDPDGAGPADPEFKCFERRNGTLGTYTPSTVYC